MTELRPYELTIEKRPHYLYAHVKSDQSRPSIAREYLKDITYECRETQCTRLIIDNDVPQSFWVWDMFSVATQFPRMGIARTKVAIVDKYAAPIQNEEFSVVVGRNCGLDVHVFSNLPDAENWMLYD